jgi:hypothetical protein
MNDSKKTIRLKQPDEMTDDERTTALGLATYARDYYKAALGADDAIGADYHYSAPSPVMHLMAHSIELGLKAYLRHSGFTVNDIKALGHNLVVCWQKAVEKGVKDSVDLTEVDLEILGIISELHVSTELRYIKVGAKTLPVFGPLTILAEKILKGVCEPIGLGLNF